MIALQLLPLDAIQPNPGQPRKHFDKEALGELADSIKAVGVLEPIVVQPAPGAFRDGFGPSPERAELGYVIVAGERRWRAAKMAGLDNIPAIVREDLGDALDAFTLSLIENVLRTDMNPTEEAEGYDRLRQAGLTVEEIAARTGKSAGSIRARLALLRLDPPILALVRVGQMDAYDAQHVSRLSVDGQYRVVSAMREGLLTKPTDLVRFVGTIYTQEAQGALFEEAAIETVAPETIRAQHSIRDDLESAARSLARVHASIDAGALRGMNLGELAEEAEGIAREAKRVGHRADGARLEGTARQQLAIGGMA